MNKKQVQLSRTTTKSARPMSRKRQTQHQKGNYKKETSQSHHCTSANVRNSNAADIACRGVRSGFCFWCLPAIFSSRVLQYCIVPIGAKRRFDGNRCQSISILEIYSTTAVQYI